MRPNRLGPPPSQRRREGYPEGTSLTWQQRIERVVTVQVESLRKKYRDDPEALYRKIVSYAREALETKPSDGMYEEVGDPSIGTDDVKMSGAFMYRVALDNVAWPGDPIKCETIMDLIQRSARERIYGPPDERFRLPTYQNRG